MRSRKLLFVLILLFVAGIPMGAATAQDIVGVWRTVDASDTEGKQQGGVVFRANNTGEFLSPTVTGSGMNAEQLLKMIETASGGSTNIKFKYTYGNSLVSMTATHMGNVAVSGSNMIIWRAEVTGRNLKLTAHDGTGKWISLTRI